MLSLDTLISSQPSGSLIENEETESSRDGWADACINAPDTSINLGSSSHDGRNKLPLDLLKPLLFSKQKDSKPIRFRRIILIGEINLLPNPAFTGD